MKKKKTTSPGDKGYIHSVNKMNRERVNPIAGTMRVIVFIALIILAVAIFNKKDPVGKVKGFFDDRSDKKEYCAERADSASTSYAAKKIYKACMSNQKAMKKKKNKKKGIVLYNVAPIMVILMGIALVFKILQFNATDSPEIFTC